MTGQRELGGVHNDCPSGKLAHFSRRGARRQALRHRQFYGDHLRPYQCDACGAWHIGHLPDAVLRGERFRRGLLRPEGHRMSRRRTRCRHPNGEPLKCRHCTWWTCLDCHHDDRHLANCPETRRRETRR